MKSVNVVRSFKYQQGYIRFEETDVEGSIISTGSFKIPARTQRVIYNDMATIVILDDGSKGVSLCGRKDEYNQLTGLKIAYTRAKIESMKKELEKLTK
jgi:hypothetical protein